MVTLTVYVLIKTSIYNEQENCCGLDDAKVEISLLSIHAKTYFTFTFILGPILGTLILPTNLTLVPVSG